MKISTESPTMMSGYQYKAEAGGGVVTLAPGASTPPLRSVAGTATLTAPTPPSSIPILRGRGPPNVKVKRKCIEVVCEPCVIFLVTTILVTALASALLSVALTSQYWEMMIYDTDKLTRLVENRTQLSVEWLYEGRVSRINGTTGGVYVPPILTFAKNASGNRLNQKFMRNQQQQQGPPTGAFGGDKSSSSSSGPLRSSYNNEPALAKSGGGGSDDDSIGNGLYSAHRESNFVFLVPLHSGVWVSCIDLTETQFDDLVEEGYGNHSHCVDHLNPDNPRPTEPRAAWQHRMQNLAIACAMVCLILLGAAVVVGLFGILRRQISAVLVTGVIYVLAALFALFTLAIVHLKHKNRHESDPLDVWMRLTPDYTEFRSARIISHGWSLQLAWAGTFVCVLASIMWILLSKIMRYNPINFLP